MKHHRRPPLISAVASGLLFAAMLVTLFAAPPALAADSEADRQFAFAVKLMQRDEPDLAREAFVEFLRTYDEDGRVDDAHYYLALLARSRGETPTAARHLDQVDDPQVVDPARVQLLRGQVALELNEGDRAVRLLEAVRPEGLPDEATRATWRYLLGVAYRRTGNTAGAVHRFEAAAESETPIRGRALLELGKARAAQGEAAAALATLNQAMQAGVDPALAAEARKLAAELAYQQKQYEQAIALYRQVIDQHQSAAEFQPALMGLLRTLYAAGRDAEAVALFNRYAAKLPAESIGEALYLKAAALVRQERYAEALRTLDQFRQRTDASHPLFGDATYLAGLTLHHLDPARYASWYDRLGETVEIPHRNELRWLRAQAAAKQDKLAEAVEILAPMIEAEDGPYARRALLQRAAWREQLGRTDPASADYAAYARLFDDDPRATDATRRAIDLAFAAGQHERVIELAGLWLNQAPNDHDARETIRLKLALAQIKMRSYGPALRTLEQLTESRPEPRIAALGHFYQGLLLASLTRPGETGGSPERAAEQVGPALEYLNRALDGPLPDSQRVEAVALSARLLRLSGRQEEALAKYERLRELRPTGEMRIEPLTALWVGRGLYEAGRAEAALPWLRQVLDRDDLEANALAQARFYTARSLQAAGDYEGAIEMYRELLGRSDSYGERGRLGLAQCLAATGQFDAALEEYNGLINVEASRIAATALLESAKIQLAAAEKLRQLAEERQAEEYRAEARRRLHRITILYDIPRLDPVPLEAMLRLGRLALDADEPVKARGYFQTVADRDDAPAWNLLGRAEVALMEGRRADAEFLLKKVRQDHPRSEAADLAEQRRRELGFAS